MEWSGRSRASERTLSVVSGYPTQGGWEVISPLGPMIRERSLRAYIIDDADGDDGAAAT